VIVVSEDTVISQQTSLSGSTLEEDAIALLREHEPVEGYYLAFSGGKDSIVIHDLTKRAGVKFKAHFHMTTVDPPEVTQFIRDNYPWVLWDRPKKSMFQIIVDHGTPPTRFRRYCCRELKEIGGRGHTVILGIRGAESARRKNRKSFEESRIDKGKFFVNPILSWADQDVWGYIRQHGLKYPSLYDNGRTRIGCVLCPLQSHNGRLQDLEDFPKFKKAYLLAFKRMLEKISSEGKKHPCGWNTPEEVMNWWINGDRKSPLYSRSRKNFKGRRDHELSGVMA
jgi:phosphoadenosine phosphosulfate reductase